MNDCIHKYIAYGFLLGSIATVIVPTDNKKFTNSLSKSQRKIYDIIIQERIYIFLSGCIFSGLFARFVDANKWTKIFLFYMLLGVYYKCHPKSYYMVEYLKNEHQLRLWNAIYKEMQFKHAFALLLNILAIPLLCK